MCSQTENTTKKASPQRLPVEAIFAIIYHMTIISQTQALNQNSRRLTFNACNCNFIAL
jgi:hypothetical protein